MPKVDKGEPTQTPKGKRRPEAADLDELMRLVAEGSSLRGACQTLGLDTPSTHTWLDEDDGRRQQYARAKEQRAEHYQEEALTVTKAAALGASVNGKTVDASGAKAYLAAIQWAVGRMAPKSGPVTKVDLTSRTRQMTDEEIAAEIAALESGRGADDSED